MLLEQIAERLIGQLLNRPHAVERQLMQRVPGLSIESMRLRTEPSGRFGDADISLPSWRASSPALPLRLRPQNNARLETAATKPMFASSFATRHCLVLADSFYEWQTLPSGKKQPYRIMLKTGEPFAMAGIYARTETDRYEAAEKSPVTFQSQWRPE
jgi:putative SOS response-associated peptidase YedK